MSPPPSSSSVEALLSKRNFPLVRPSVARKGIKLFTGCRFSFPRPPPAGKIVGNCLAPKTSGTLSGGIAPIPCRGVYPRQRYRVGQYNAAAVYGKQKREKLHFPINVPIPSELQFFLLSRFSELIFFSFPNECAHRLVVQNAEEDGQSRSLGAFSFPFFFFFSASVPTYSRTCI